MRQAGFVVGQMLRHVVERKLQAKDCGNEPIRRRAR